MIEIGGHKYIQVNKKLYEVLSEWIHSPAGKCMPTMLLLHIRELECYPVKIEYYAHEDIFKYWFPGREN